jgi:low temperature requirement protein LtrA
MTEEKKVEYLELIYDLIFVYIIGRNNSLIQDVENGFISGSAFLAYALCSLAVIQILNYTTFYINLYGRNSKREHIFLFVNMYLLYFIGEGIRRHWNGYHGRFHLAWALILINIGIQYLIEMRHHRGEPAAMQTIKGLLVALFGDDDEVRALLLCLQDVLPLSCPRLCGISAPHDDVLGDAGGWAASQ